MKDLRDIIGSLIAYEHFGVMFGAAVGALSGIVSDVVVVIQIINDRSLPTDDLVAIIWILVAAAIVGALTGTIIGFVNWLINGAIGCGCGAYIAGCAVAAVLGGIYLRDLLLNPFSIGWALCGLLTGTLIRSRISRFAWLNRIRQHLDAHNLSQVSLWERAMVKAGLALLFYAGSAGLALDVNAPVWVDDAHARTGKVVCPGPRPLWPLCWEPDGDDVKDYQGNEWVFVVYAPLCTLWRTQHGYIPPIKIRY